MSREQHLQWCKDRAIQILESGDVSGAYASMVSDFGKDDSTANHPAIGLGMQMFSAGLITNKLDMKKFIEGFN